MSNTQQIHERLLEIGKSFDETEEFTLSKTEVNRKAKSLLTYPELKQFDLDANDIKVIACAWNKYFIDRRFSYDPLDLLSMVFSDPAKQLKEMDRIIKLLKKNIFYSSKKVVRTRHRSTFKRKQDQTNVNYNKYTLIEEHISFHRSFIRVLLSEAEDISLNRDKPYKTNKEFITDWFSYIDQLKEFSWWDFKDRNIGKPLDEGPANELLQAMEWKDKITNRLERTSETFPLMDITDEYRLDDNEAVILMYLVKDDMEGEMNTDTDEIIKLVSRDQHEMYRNRNYVTIDSKLVKNGLVELSDNVFFRTKASDIRVAPDITRRIIMRTPINDEERLTQILKGEDLFTLLNPRQTFKELILPAEMKKTIRTGMNRYEKNVDATLNSWGLYDGGMDVIGKPKKRMEPGLLMLFYGNPGTGKTFAAGAIANALGKKLLVTDISRIQSKWVGDSEKNVRRMFTIFERIVRRVDNPPVLLLNEADQFLTRRTGNTDTSVDIMYNTLQNLFLEAFEQLRGILIATTNLKSNLDTAFSRRFHLKLDFPIPSAAERGSLWKLHLPMTIPGASVVDITPLAEYYELTGGQISIVVRNAATEAASRTEANLTQADLVKYCEIETASMFDRKKPKIGYEA